MKRAPRKGAPPPQDDTLGALPGALAEKAPGKPTAKAEGKKRKKAAREAPKAVSRPEPKPAPESAPETAKAGAAKAEPARPVRKDRTEPLNFRVSAEFRRAFKRAAAAQDCKKVDLLERIFAEWSARNPG
ncbi:hypothetical protein BKE38_07085 [Pseudoroseomonas deserti]|uniref:Uncharacterized protein n=1 Tax=Teichococcus deserti TaxID=1817963 RepID=A0A1V2H700_9PROT|nr:hypothetical protein BKE38_07085 [Pseudoroseomonas deserti]